MYYVEWIEYGDRDRDDTVWIIVNERAEKNSFINVEWIYYY